jgi:hypothetical protein
MKTLLYLILLLPSICLGQWTPEQKGLAAAALVVTAIDYGQTRTVAKDPRWHEENPLMGRHPSTRKVAAHFIAVPVLTYFVLDNISSENRSLALKVILAVEIGFVAHNYSLGVRASF